MTLISGILIGVNKITMIIDMQRNLTLLAVALPIFIFLSCTKAGLDSNDKTVEIKDEGIAITDVTFKKYCYEKFDVDKDGKIDADEANTVTRIVLDNNLGIVSVQGIEIFCNLKFFSACQCSNLRDANLYNNTKLEEADFANCTGLISVTLPDSIIMIDYMGFYNCPGLKAINLPRKISSIKGKAFAFCSGLSSLVVPDSVKSIGEFAFQGCKNLTDIYLPEGLNSIGEQAFFNCTGLNSITLPSTITSIGDVVCLNCTSLRLFSCKAITPPTIGGQPFMACIQLGSILVPQVSVAKYKAASGWRSYSSKIVGSSF